MKALNPYQERRVASTFAHVDDLLQSVERLVHAQSTAFSREHPDISDGERRLLGSLVETARARMLEMLDHLGMPRPAAALSARWSIETALSFADIALSELNARTMEGYGKIDPESAAELGAVVSDLRDVVRRGRALLQPREGEQLRDRLTELAGPLGTILRAMEAFSAEHGLAEVRPLIAAAAERAAANAIEVGIFGRVSAGKSSLINALVGAPILPVGATPVTAVPLRVVHGTDERRVFFADGYEELVESSRLPDFATEAGNRDNTRGVTSIRIQTPLLPDGVALLDTPGVGSLSQSGPAQAFAWLPRCDLGIVLVAAGTPLGRDELALVSGLTHAGIAVQVLLSKSDLIPEAERESTVEYVRTEVERASGSRAIPIRAVSVVGSDARLLERWRDEQLTPLAAARRTVADAARARRVRSLLGAMNAAVTARPALDRVTVDLHRARLDAHREITAAADELEASARQAIAGAADAAAKAWHDGADAGAAVRQALLDAPMRTLQRARTAADQVVVGTGAETGDDTALRLPPLFDPPWLDAPPIAQAPGFFDRLSPRGAAGAQLGPLAKPLDDAYGTYAQRVRAWALERVEERFARLVASRGRDSAFVAPALHSLALLVDEYFPAPVDAGL
jgi:GTP-binding protein EngB required for normal cell division